LNVDHIERLEKNIIETICKLEMIFPPSFFDLMEHLPVYLPFKVKVGGLVQYRWMYPFERLDITVVMTFIIKCFYFILIFLIDNFLFIYIYIYIYAGTCSILKKRLRTRRMLRRQYVKRILLRRSQHLSHIISNLI